METISIWITVVFGTGDEDGEAGMPYVAVHGSDMEAREALGRWCRATLREDVGSPWQHPEDYDEEWEEPGRLTRAGDRPARKGERRAVLGSEAALEDAISTYFETHAGMQYEVRQTDIFVEKGRLL